VSEASRAVFLGDPRDQRGASSWDCWRLCYGFICSLLSPVLLSIATVIRHFCPECGCSCRPEVLKALNLPRIWTLLPPGPFHSHHRNGLFEGCEGKDSGLK